MPLLGTETEYGILAPDAPELSPALLSAAVVDSWDGPATTPPATGPADVPLEDPHNRFLGNGGRLYVDHAHPEFATPEVTSPLDAVRYDLAGDAIVRRGAELASARLGTPVRLFKNNTDGKGASYGFHENYLVPRSLPWSVIAPTLLTHLVTRLPLTGAGRVGLGQAGQEPGFQVSQRADFFEQLTGLETTVRRPLVNTRDEPHADPRRWRRLHVIAGDANQAHTSRLLTVATTSLVLSALEAGMPVPAQLADPLASVRTVSRDLTCTALLTLTDGRRLTALDLQEQLIEAVAAAGVAADADLALWREPVTALRADPRRAADRLDWVAKWQLLSSYRDRDGLGWDAPRLAQLDLRYAELDPARSVYAALVRAGRLRELVTDAEVAQAVHQPPSDTRAWFRGTVIQRAPGSLDSVDWQLITGRGRGGSRSALRLDDPWGWPDPDAWLAEVSR